MTKRDDLSCAGRRTGASGNAGGAIIHSQHLTASSERQFGNCLCHETGEDNDTSVQSQPCRNAGSRNEGGSVRTTEGLVTHEAVPAAA